MAMLEGLVDIAEIQHMVWRGMSHRNIAITIHERFPGRRGISERSIRRFCRSNNISRISNVQLDLVVQDFVELYGHGYGRAMMQGSIRSFIGATTGVISQRRVSQSLLRVAPLAYEERTRDIFERTNPIPYYAPYFGYKCHMDQNEKIAQNFGCTHVALIDGCSRMICGYANMPVKNPILIYEFVFRPALVKYGLWNQLRLDHGLEFVLCIFVQETLKVYRRSQEKDPWKQTASTQKNVIERFWPEMNSRVNYPIKRAFVQIQEINDYFF